MKRILSVVLAVLMMAVMAVGVVPGAIAYANEGVFLG